MGLIFHSGLARLRSVRTHSARMVLLCIRLVVLTSMPQAIVSAQQTVPLPIEAVLSTREFVAFTPVEFSPDGTWIAYAAKDKQRNMVRESLESTSAGVPFYAKDADVWLVNTRTHETRNLTGGHGSNWSPAWSPDGRDVAFLSDRDGDKEAKVWIWDAAANALRKVSDVPVGAGKIAWMPRSRQLLTTARPEDSTPENYMKGEGSSGNASKHQQELKAPGSSVVVYKSDIVRLGDRRASDSDPWSLDGYLGDLVLLNVATGSVQRLARNTRISKFVASPTGAQVAFSSPTHFERAGSQQVLWDLTVITVSDRHTTVVASDIRLDYDGGAFTWSPDSSGLAYLTGGPLEASAGIADCFLVNSNGGTRRNVTMFPQQTLFAKQRPPLWDASGTSIYVIRNGSMWKTDIAQGRAKELVAIPGRQITEFVAHDGNRLWSPDDGKSTVVLTFDREAKQSAFYKVELERGSVAKLLERGQCYECGDVDEHVFSDPKDSGLAYFSQDSERPEDLWIADSDFRNPLRLTDLNPQLEGYRMGTVRLVQWLSDDGESLHGILLLPSDYHPAKRYPLIVWVYGGSGLSGRLEAFGSAGPGPFNLQLLATRGYAMLLPDSPSHPGTPMLDLAKTVLPGVNKVIDMGIADPDRLGVMGHSNGGYSTLALIVQTKRFRAAVEIDGLGDLVSDYGEMDEAGDAFAISNLEHGQDALGGTPWEMREKYIENSPTFFLDRVETPVLIVHGGEDRTVAPFMGDELFVGLRRLGKEVEYDKYEGEGHSPLDWSHANQADFCKRMISWLERHLEDRGGDNP